MLNTLVLLQMSLVHHPRQHTYIIHFELGPLFQSILQPSKAEKLTEVVRLNTLLLELIEK